MATGFIVPNLTTNSLADVTGEFPGGFYKIDHRDSNTLLSITLLQSSQFYAQPGAMVAMTPDVKLKGKLKFSLKKMLAGNDMSQSIYTGPGEILLAPAIWGDIVALPVDGNTQWSVGRGGYLAMSDGVSKETKSQSASKALFSGEGFFIQKFSGKGMIFITSLGAIIQRQLKSGEQLIVDNGHLVAWNCSYAIERAGGSLSSNMHTGEGLVCRFTGPGTLYLQTRNPEALGEWIASHTQPN